MNAIISSKNDGSEACPPANDLSKDGRGKSPHANAQPKLPAYLDTDVEAYLPMARIDLTSLTPHNPSAV